MVDEPKDDTLVWPKLNGGPEWPTEEKWQQMLQELKEYYDKR